MAKPWGMKGIAENFMYTELQDDWDQFQVFMECGLKRFEALETGYRHWESDITPDDTPYDPENRRPRM